MFTKTAYILTSLLILLNILAYILFNTSHLVPLKVDFVTALIGIILFTYLLDIALYFYYLKNDHLNKSNPRIVMTVFRTSALVGVFMMTKI